MRGFARRIVHFGARLGGIAALSLLPFALGSCDTFSGSVLALSIAYPQIPGLPPTLTLPTGDPIHLEMWAGVTDGATTKYVRLPADIGGKDPASPDSFSGFTPVRAIDPNDPCLIRALDRDDEDCNTADSPTDMCGAQMFSKPAQIVPDGSTPDLAQLGLVLQARKVTAADTQFKAYDPTVTGRAPSPLIALVQYNPDFANDPRDPRKGTSLPATTVSNAGDPSLAATRKQRCLDYRGATDNDEGRPGFYVGNPRQYTKPLSGTLFGFFSFQTCTSPTPPTCPIATTDLPNQSFSGITFSVPMALDTIQGLLITVESTANPTTPSLGTVLYTSALNSDCTGGPGRQPDYLAGRGTIKFLMCVNTNPAFSPQALTLAGTASVMTNLDSGLN